MTTPVGTDLLGTLDVAQFVATGLLVLPGVVAEDLNVEAVHRGRSAFAPEPAPGMPLAEAFSPETLSGRMLATPAVRGALRSLVGASSHVDHLAVFLLLSEDELASLGHRGPLPPQGWHQDAHINTRLRFDLHVMWYPQEVTAAMGPTRYLPGSHLRTVSEYLMARSQNFIGQRSLECPAGTIALFHHGLWHGAGSNRSNASRLAIKYRIGASGSQTLGWDTSGLAALLDAEVGRPAFASPHADRASLHDTLFTTEPWMEDDTVRLEFMNRVRLWRYLVDDESCDLGHWLGRVDLDDRRWDHRA